MKLTGKTLPGFRGTFPQAGKPCPVSEEHFPGRENLARFQGNISPSGKTLPGFRGTFSQAGKPCSVSEGHFPEWENLARFQGNISPGGKYLAAFYGRLSTIVCSSQSFPVRPHQGVCDTPLHFPAKYLHKTAPSITVPSMNKW